MRLLLLPVLLLLTTSTLAQDRERGGRAYPPEMPGAKVVTYKTVGKSGDGDAPGAAELKLYIYEPAGWKPSSGKAGEGRPAIVLFFGGGWRNGSPLQFLQHCKYLASRGMVAIAADYRVASRHGVKAVDCVRDAKSAIRYVRQHAGELGVDPERLAAGGGSAGGHLAAACGTIEGLDEPSEDATISSRPNALVLFNPAVVLAPVEGIPLNTRGAAGFEDRLGIEPQALSPYHHVKSGAPPTAIFHGRDDQTVPYASVEAFNKAMREAGNTCELFGYDGLGHSFFNYGRGGNKMYAVTLREADKFLTKLGYLSGEPTLEE